MIAYSPSPTGVAGGVCLVPEVAVSWSLAFIKPSLNFLRVVFAFSTKAMKRSLPLNGRTFFGRTIRRQFPSSLMGPEPRAAPLGIGRRIMYERAISDMS